MDQPRAIENAPALEAIAPIFSVSDVPAALAYYQNVLGFALAWTWGEPPRLVSVCRDRVEINLAVLDAAGSARVSKVYVQMTGVDAYCDQIANAGAKVVVPLADREYGMRDFRIVDPWDNELSFGEATGHEGAGS
jgi:uncharacterized glyoxalase superfamily protein PhnB